MIDVPEHEHHHHHIIIILNPSPVFVITHTHTHSHTLITAMTRPSPQTRHQAWKHSSLLSIMMTYASLPLLCFLLTLPFTVLSYHLFTNMPLFIYKKYFNTMHNLTLAFNANNLLFILRLAHVVTTLFFRMTTQLYKKRPFHPPSRDR